MDKVILKDVDCVHLRVANLEDGLAFYRDKLGLKMLWKTETSCGLGTENHLTEIVLSTKALTTIDFKVDNINEALEEFIKAGGKILDGPFDIDVGKCAVVTDPWENEYCLLDLTNGTYDADNNGVVYGVSIKNNQ